MSFNKQKIYQRRYPYLPNSVIWDPFSTERWPHNPEYTDYPENCHPCITLKWSTVFRKSEYLSREAIIICLIQYFRLTFSLKFASQTPKYNNPQKKHLWH